MESSKHLPSSGEVKILQAIAELKRELKEDIGKLGEKIDRVEWRLIELGKVIKDAKEELKGGTKEELKGELKQLKGELDQTREELLAGHRQLEARINVLSNGQDIQNTD